MRTPRASQVESDEEHDLERHERQDAEVLAEQQLPARDGLGEQDRRRARFQERRDESRGPDQGQQQSEGAGDAPGEEQFEEMDGIAALAADGKETAPKARVMRPLIVSTPSRRACSGSALRVDHAFWLGRSRRGHGAQAEPAAGRAPARPRRAATRLPTRSRSGRAATQIAVTASIIPQIPDAQACRNVSRISCFSVAKLRRERSWRAPVKIDRSAPGPLRATARRPVAGSRSSAASEPR